MIKYFVAMVIVLCLGATSAVAQEHTPLPAAKAAFDQATDALSKPNADDGEDYKAAVQFLRKAIDLDPEFYDAYSSYIVLYRIAAAPDVLSPDQKKSKAAQPAFDNAGKQLEQQYEKLAAEHPEKAVYAWAAGDALFYDDPDRSVSYFKQALKIDPNCGPAYDMLAIDAEGRGDLKLSLEYARKAYEAWPGDEHIWGHYVAAYTSQPTPENLAKAEQIDLDGAKKFPDEAARTLGYIAGRSTDDRQARTLFELMRERFPDHAKGYTLIPLFNLYLKSDRAKALALATDMVKGDPSNKQWPQLENYAQALLDTDALVAKGETEKALAKLDAVKLPPRVTDSRWLDLARAKVMASKGRVDKAYDSLLSIFAATPSDEVRLALDAYGKKLGKAEAQVGADIDAKRASTAKDGIPFTLTSYETGKPVSLSNYKGRVVVVNFWYPKCGPCRGEFPYLQQTLEKYKAQGFEILAINGHAPEDELVMPLIQGWRLGFIPLKGTDEVISAYNVHGYPKNILYGPDGKIYPMPSQIHPDSLREFQIQIQALLQQANQKPSAPQPE
jgi:thiol-disulfide isomerase/thioredoxin/Tfp pilus assembly protein PilF